MKTWIMRMKQAVAVRLMSLKRKSGKAAFQRWCALAKARLHHLKEQAKEAFLVVKCGILLIICKLYLVLSREGLSGLVRRIRQLPKQLTRENFRKWGQALWVWICGLPQKLRDLRKHGVLASVALLMLLIFLGNGATKAWLTYTTPTIQNAFVIEQMDLYVEYRNDQMTVFREMKEDSSLFHDEALYEPGYTQIVYLYVENRGEVPFDYKFIVREFTSQDSTNVNGGELVLADHLYFGIVTADTLKELEEKLANRATAQSVATIPLGDYSKPGSKQLAGGDCEYAALVVCMPTWVGNEANYDPKVDVQPSITLGVTVYAQQANTMTTNP